MDVCESLVVEALDRTAELPDDVRVCDILEGAEGAESDSGTSRANSGRNGIDHFPDEAGTVFGAAAIVVCALVDVVTEELVKKVAVLRRRLADAYSRSQKVVGWLTAEWISTPSKPASIAV